MRVLEQDAKDVDGLLLRAGTRVLSNPVAPEEFRKDDPAAWQRFRARDCAWSELTRCRIWLPISISDERHAVEQTPAYRREQFVTALDENLKSAVGGLLPAIRLPPAFKFIPWDLRIEQTDTPWDLGGIFADRLLDLAGVPPEVTHPRDSRAQAHVKEWKGRHIRSWNSVSVYRLANRFADIHVVAAFVSGRFVDGTGDPGIPREWKPCLPDQPVLDALRAVYRVWFESCDLRKPLFTFFTAGTASSWAPGIAGSASGADWIVLSQPAADDSWQSLTPARVTDRIYLRDFLDCLKPETEQQRIGRIKTIIDDFLDRQEPGHLTVDKIKTRSGYRRTIIERGLVTLQDTHHYRLYRERGILAIDRRRTPHTKRIAVDAGRNGRFQRYSWTLLSPVIAAGVGTIPRMLLGYTFDFRFLLLTIPFAYLGRAIDVFVARYKKERD